MFTKHTTLKEKIENRFFKALKPLLYRHAKTEFLTLCGCLFAISALSLLSYYSDSLVTLLVSPLLGMIILTAGKITYDRFKNLQTLSKSNNLDDLNTYSSEILAQANKYWNFSLELTPEEIQEMFNSGLNSNQLDYLTNLIVSQEKIKYRDYLHIERLFPTEDVQDVICEAEMFNLKKEREREIKTTLETFFAKNNLTNQIYPQLVREVINNHIKDEFGEVEKEYKSML